MAYAPMENVALQLTWFDGNQKPLASQVIEYGDLSQSEGVYLPKDPDVDASNGLILAPITRAGQYADYPVPIGLPVLQPVPGAKFLKVRVLEGSNVHVKVTIA